MTTNRHFTSSGSGAAPGQPVPRKVSQPAPAARPAASRADALIPVTTTAGDGGADVLRPGTPLLRGQYRIVSFLSAGGFGITYLARDSLDRTVVLKECFPSAMCFREGSTVEVRSQGSRHDFDRVVSQFGTEARRLARLSHRNIVGVHQVFEDNGTAYIALDLIRGHDLLDVIEGNAPPLDPDQIKELLLKLLEAVAYVHGQDILHRDISPDNILIDDQGEPVLIDFGAAREEAIRTSRLLSTLHTVKDGYSPYEFYVIGSAQGLSSDLYSLAATFYHLITGKAPPDAQSRVAAIAEGRPDPYVPLTDFDRIYDSWFVGALNQALSVFPRDRMASAEDWIDQIHEERRRAAALDRAREDKRVEASILRLVAETNEAVMADRRSEGDPDGSVPAPQGFQQGPQRVRTARRGTAGTATVPAARGGRDPADLLEKLDRLREAEAARRSGGLFGAIGRGFGAIVAMAFGRREKN